MHECAAEHTWTWKYYQEMWGWRRREWRAGRSRMSPRGFLSCVTECGFVGFNSLLFFKLNLHVLKISFLSVLCILWLILISEGMSRNESPRHQQESNSEALRGERRQAGDRHVPGGTGRHQDRHPILLRQISVLYPFREEPINTVGMIWVRTGLSQWSVRLRNGDSCSSHSAPLDKWMK